MQKGGRKTIKIKHFFKKWYHIMQPRLVTLIFIAKNDTLYYLKKNLPLNQLTKGLNKVSTTGS